ncbi:MAG: hypothetical protein K2P52_02545 [Campylobacterales bacterium]|nr:hypothetical protein [Campylobacterales bacterium]
MIDKINDTYLVYSFIKRLVKPFTSWDAYKLGVIDETGNILIPVKNRSLKQKQSLLLFDLMVLNMKKILGNIPGGNSKFATYSAALYLIKEDTDNFSELDFKKFMMDLDEEVVNNVGSGNIAGVNNQDSFGGHKIFKVNSDTIDKNRKGRKKYSRYSKSVGDDEVGKSIKSFALKNPKAGIALQDYKTNELIILRREAKNARNRKN